MPAACSSRMITRAQTRDVVGTLGQRAVADGRVGRACQHVQHGCVVEVDADRGQLVGQRAGESRRERPRRRCDRVSAPAATR